jgi:modification methylase
MAPFVTAREAPRVPFASLIERGTTVGSIHRIGDLAQGLEACNGWAFWHVETLKGLISIDAPRAEARAEKATS